MRAYHSHWVGLPALRELHLAENVITACPDDSGPYKVLETLTIGTPYVFGDNAVDVHSFTATVDLGTLPKLRIAAQQFGSHRVHYFPSNEFWNAPHLEYLDLSFQFDGSLPQNLWRASNLRVLSCALGGEHVVAAAETLAKLPKLALVNLNLFSKLTRKQFAVLVGALPNTYIRHETLGSQYGSNDYAERERAEKLLNEDKFEKAILKADKFLQTVDFRHCFKNAGHFEAILEIKTKAMKWLGIEETDAQRRKEMAQAGGTWAEQVLAIIPDATDHLRRWPLAKLALIRLQALMCRALHTWLCTDEGSLAVLESLNEVEADARNHYGPVPPFTQEEAKIMISQVRDLIQSSSRIKDTD